MVGAKPIVVGTDGSQAALRAVRWAAAEARWRHVPLRIVHAAGVAGNDDSDRILAAAADEVPGVETTTSAATGEGTTALLAESGGAQLVVVGATGLGAFPGLLVGSVPSILAAHAFCPVAVVRDAEGTGPVVAGIDGGPQSAAVIEAAFEGAAQRGAPLVAAHAWSDADLGAPGSQRYFGWEPVADAERRVLAENLAGWQEKYPDVTVERVAVRDRPRHLLLELSRRARLLVVGSRGRGGFAELLLGSTGQAAISHARSTVLVMR